jgi:hypothetical protein
MVICMHFLVPSGSDVTVNEGIHPSRDAIRKDGQPL